MKFIAIFLCVSSVLVLVNGQDWCKMPGCTINTHIACNNNGAFAKTCVNPKSYTLTAAQVQRILDAHNQKRNQVATGSLKPFPPAIRMAKMTWNEEMAKLAALNTKQCKMNHDKCRSTVSFKYSGQNLAVMWNTGTYTAEQVIEKAVNGWFSEYVNATEVNIKTVGTPAKGEIGHFTAVVTELSTQVGCAISSFTDGKFNAYLLACNYASTNMGKCSVYRSGSVASACTTEADKTYPGLCSAAEKIDANALNFSK